MKKRRMSAREIKRRVEALNAGILKAREAERKACNRRDGLQLQLREIQGQCPHPEENQEFAQDTAEMKLRPFCTTCGVRIH